MKSYTMFSLLNVYSCQWNWALMFLSLGADAIDRISLLKKIFVFERTFNTYSFFDVIWLNLRMKGLNQSRLCFN